MANKNYSTYSDYIKDLATPIKRVFDQQRLFSTISLATAIYWNDEAEDECHTLWFASALDEPDFESQFEWEETKWGDEMSTNANMQMQGTSTLDTIVLGTTDREKIIDLFSFSSARDNPVIADFFDKRSAWNDTAMFIPWCVEGASQELETRDNYRPCLTFHRDGRLTWHEMVRPHVFESPYEYLSDEYIDYYSDEEECDEGIKVSTVKGPLPNRWY